MSIRTNLLIATSIVAVSFSAVAGTVAVDAVKGAVADKAAVVETKTTEVKKEIAPAAEVKADAKKVEEMKKEVAPAVKH